MLKNHWRLVSRFARVVDNLLIVLAFYISYTFRDSILEFGYRAGVVSGNQTGLALGQIEDYYIVLGLTLPIFNALLELLGGYRSMRLSSAWQLLRITGFAAILTFLCQGSLLYFLKLDLSRSFVGLFCGLSGVSLFVERLIMLRLLRYFRVRGRNFRNVLVVGTGSQARQLYREIVKQHELGLRVVGFVELHDPQTAAVATEIYDLPARIVADRATFESTLKKYAVDEVLFTDAVESLSTLREMAQIAVEEGVRVTLAANIFSLEIFNSEMSYFGEVPLIHYSPAAGVSDSGAHVIKRVLDLVFSAIALVVLFPLMLFVAILIKLESPGPVFFRQRRVGLNGRTFTLLKFRSMVNDAERMLPELLSKNEMTGPVFKMKQDPRITAVGRFIRRFSIDELPQLINVLRGDMSIVGPRPPLPDEVSLYLRKHRKRLSMRPGLTCIWQVSGRNEIPDFERWAELDLEYIDNWSLKKDFELIMKTIPAVLSGIGAR
ncbi:MAG: sugar transferase [Bdellovibrionota bacterium]